MSRGGKKEVLVYFHATVVGKYKADLIVNGVVLLEIKSVEKLMDAHDASCSATSNPRNSKQSYH
jgi:hypothetical protein